jgi:hypothetical protein
VGKFDLERAAGTGLESARRACKFLLFVIPIGGYDTNGSLTPGVLIYFIDTSIPSGSGPLKVLPINDADANKNTAALLPGASVTLGTVTVTFVSQDANGDRVRLVR